MNMLTAFVKNGLSLAINHVPRCMIFIFELEKLPIFNINFEWVFLMVRAIVKIMKY